MRIAALDVFSVSREEDATFFVFNMRAASDGKTYDVIMKLEDDEYPVAVTFDEWFHQMYERAQRSLFKRTSGDVFSVSEAKCREIYEENSRQAS